MKIARWVSALLLSVPFVVWSAEASGSSNVSEALNEAEGVTEVAPVEDLMREHGVLERLLLIYEEINHRLATNTSFAPKLLTDSATIVQKFVENYHEKLEEDFLFPRLEKREQMKDLIKTLIDQHQKGRLLTTYIIEHGTAADLQDKEKTKTIRSCLEQYITMFRPHIAREDTVVFPYFKTLISEQEYLFLGDVFENKEKTLFGAEGFFKIVDDVAKIEKALGIYTLGRFTATETPKLSQKIAHQ